MIDPRDEIQLNDLLDGRLSPAEADALRLRIAQEPSFAEAWDDLRRVRALAKALPDPAVPPDFRERVRARLASAGPSDDGEVAATRARSARRVMRVLQVAYAVAALVVAVIGVRWAIDRLDEAPSNEREVAREREAARESGSTPPEAARKTPAPEPAPTPVIVPPETPAAADEKLAARVPDGTGSTLESVPGSVPEAAPEDAEASKDQPPPAVAETRTHRDTGPAAGGAPAIEPGMRDPSDPTPPPPAPAGPPPEMERAAAGVGSPTPPSTPPTAPDVPRPEEHAGKPPAEEDAIKEVPGDTAAGPEVEHAAGGGGRGGGIGGAERRRQRTALIYVEATDLDTARAEIALSVSGLRSPGVFRRFVGRLQPDKSRASDPAGGKSAEETSTSLPGGGAAPPAGTPAPARPREGRAAEVLGRFVFRLTPQEQSRLDPDSSRDAGDGGPADVTVVVLRAP